MVIESAGSGGLQADGSDYGTRSTGARLRGFVLCRSKSSCRAVVCVVVGVLDLDPIRQRPFAGLATIPSTSCAQVTSKKSLPRAVMWST
jgi:hypothetical protein